MVMVVAAAAAAAAASDIYGALPVCQRVCAEGPALLLQLILSSHLMWEVLTLPSSR